MMHTISTILLAMSLAAAPVDGASIEAAEPSIAATTVALVQQQQLPEVTPTPQPGSAAGLPQRAPWARTMAEFWPVFAAFVVTWIGILVYFLTLGGRMTRITRSLQELRPRREE